ncbi:hypothetical protein KC331_g13032 [Hortaea werneckii]|nr:hypothetical protein KC331_g13032 [Hortaea werneckii]
MGWVPSRRPPELEAEEDEEVATPGGWCWGMAPPDWDWEGKPGRRFGGEEVVTCGLKVTLRGGLGDGRDGMDCGWEGVMEEELEWVGKSGVVSEEDMMAEEVKMEVCAEWRAAMQAWLKMAKDRPYHRACPNVPINFPGRMLYLSDSHVTGYTAADWMKRQKAAAAAAVRRDSGDNRQTPTHCAAVMQSSSECIINGLVVCLVGLRLSSFHPESFSCRRSA